MLLSRTLLLKEPNGALHSLDELFALADAMEREAASKYEELSTAMNEQGRQDLAAVFAELAAAEREHVEGVSKWSQSRLGRPPDPTDVRWQVPATFDPDATREIKASRLISPYQALAMAVQNEERAFAFWSYMAAFAKDPDIKAAAETMAGEELGHVATLRKERRHAYRSERSPRHHRPEGDAESTADKVDARTLELRLAAQFYDLDRQPSDAKANRLRELREETFRMSDEVAGIGKFPAEILRRDPYAIAEALADAYLEAAETATDQDHVDLLQRMAAKAIARLAWLRSLVNVNN